MSNTRFQTMPWQQMVDELYKATGVYPITVEGWYKLAAIVADRVEELEAEVEQLRGDSKRLDHVLEWCSYSLERCGIKSREDIDRRMKEGGEHAQ